MLLTIAANQITGGICLQVNTPLGKNKTYGLGTQLDSEGTSTRTNKQNQWRRGYSTQWESVFALKGAMIEFLPPPDFHLWLTCGELGLLANEWFPNQFLQMWGLCCRVQKIISNGCSFPIATSDSCSPMKRKRRHCDAAD